MRQSCIALAKAKNLQNFVSSLLVLFSSQSQLSIIYAFELNLARERELCLRPDSSSKHTSQVYATEFRSNQIQSKGTDRE